MDAYNMPTRRIFLFELILSHFPISHFVVFRLSRVNRWTHCGEWVTIKRYFIVFTTHSAGTRLLNVIGQFTIIYPFKMLIILCQVLTRSETRIFRVDFVPWPILSLFVHERFTTSKVYFWYDINSKQSKSTECFSGPNKRTLFFPKRPFQLEIV